MQTEQWVGSALPLVFYLFPPDQKFTVWLVRSLNLSQILGAHESFGTECNSWCLFKQSCGSLENLPFDFSSDNRKVFQEKTQTAKEADILFFQDGNFGTNYHEGSCTHTKHDPGSWWLVDLGQKYRISRVQVTNQGDCCGI